MKKIMLLCFFAVVPCIANNNFEMKIKVTNSNGDTLKNKSLFGIKDGATKYIDKSLGEFAIPALVPGNDLSSAFRFYELSWDENVLSYYDFRPDFESDRDSIVYNYEISGVVNEFTLEWGEFPSGIKSAVMKSKYISDKYNYFDMKAVKSIKVENPAVTEFTIILKNYDPTNSVDENEELVKVYPIPAKDNVLIESNIEITSVSIIDLYGKSYKVEILNNVINVEHLPVGMYNLIIISGDKQIFRKNIIKI